MLGKGGFLGGSAVKNLPAMQELQETWVLSPSWEDTLEEVLAASLVFLPAQSWTQLKQLSMHTCWGKKGGSWGLKRLPGFRSWLGSWSFILHVY